MRRALPIALLFIASIQAGHAEDQKQPKPASHNAATPHSRLIDANNLRMGITNMGRFSPSRLDNRQFLRFKHDHESTLLYDAGLVLGAVVNDTVRVMVNAHTADVLPGPLDEHGQPWGPEDARCRTYKIGLPGDPEHLEDEAQWPAVWGAPVNADGSPQRLGDQTLFSVCNDGALVDGYHQRPRTPLGAEIRLTAWTWAEMDDLIFLRWQIINKSPHQWRDAAVGLWGDCELLNAGNDAVASDSGNTLVYCYNRDSKDYRHPNAALGFQLLETPTTAAAGETARAGRITLPGRRNTPVFSPPATKRDWKRWGDFENPPRNAQSYLRLLGLDIDGNPIINPLTGQATAWSFTGDPINQNGWLDPIKMDRRFWISAGPFDMAPGDTQYVALTVLTGDGNNAWDGIRRLREMAPLARAVYQDAGALYTPHAVVDPAGPFELPLILANPDIAVNQIQVDLTLPEGTTLMRTQPTVHATAATHQQLDDHRYRLTLVPADATGGQRALATLTLETTASDSSMRPMFSNVEATVNDARDLRVHAFASPVAYNHRPADFSLTTPPDHTVLNQARVTFSWTPAVDVENETPVYRMQVMGWGNWITTTQTSVMLDIPPYIVEDSTYTWTVKADDETYRVAAADTFHFSLPSGFYSQGIRALAHVPLPGEGYLQSIQMDGTRLYTLYNETTDFTAQSHHYRLRAFDLSRPDTPVFLGDWIHQNDTWNHGVVIEGQRAYLCFRHETDWNLDSLLILDLSDPAAITHSATLTTGQGKLTASEHRLFLVNDKLTVYDVQNPAEPHLTHSLALPDREQRFIVSWPYVLNRDETNLSLYKIDDDTLKSVAQFTAPSPIVDLGVGEDRVLMVTQETFSHTRLWNANGKFGINTVTVLDWADRRGFDPIGSWDIYGYQPGGWRFSGDKITASYGRQQLIFNPQGQPGPAIESATPEHRGYKFVRSPYLYTAWDQLHIYCADNLSGGQPIKTDSKKPAFSPNFPNPFHDHTLIPCRWTGMKTAEIAIFNILGQCVKTWTEPGFADSEWHFLQWDGRDNQGCAVPAGVYLCRVTAADRSDVAKLVKY